jgi:hypothetical protein
MVTGSLRGRNLGTSAQNPFVQSALWKVSLNLSVAAKWFYETYLSDKKTKYFKGTPFL